MSRKLFLFIGIVVAAIVIIVLLISILPSKYTGEIKKVLSGINLFKAKQAPAEEEYIDPGPSKINETPSAHGGGGTSGTTTPPTTPEEVEYGDGRLSISNRVGDYNLGGGSLSVVHLSSGTEGYDAYDRIYCTPHCLFNPSGKKTKIISRITDYELERDFRPTNSLSTIYLELSLDSQTSGDITINSSNELRLSLPLVDSGYNFTGKTLTLQQYDPNNASASYTLYNVRDVIANQGGVITLPDLDGTYASEVPYAYFRLEF